jgi:hypothetical protein
MTYKLKFSTTLYLAMGLITGLLFSLLFRSCTQPDLPLPVSFTNVPAKQIEKAQQKTEQGFAKRIDSLQGRNRAMRTALNNTQKELAKADRRNVILQTKVYSLIDRQALAKEDEDTITAIENCDSLAALANDLILGSLARDSLADAQAVQLTVQVQNRDSVIQLQQSAYTALKQDFQISILNQQVLEANNKQYKKLLKKQRRKTGLAAIAGVIISGITLKALLNK